MLYKLLVSSHMDETAPVLTDTVDSLSYKQINALCAHIGQALKRFGVRSGDRVIIIAERSLSTVLTILACIRTGVCFIPLSPDASTKTIESIIDDSSPRLVIGELREPAAVQYIKTDKLISMAESEEIDGEASSDDPMVYILYTSGSTGTPKGVVAPEENVVFCINSINARLKNTSSDRILCCLPLSFDYGLYQIFLALASGACVVVPPEAPLSQIVSHLIKERITGFPAMPAMLNILLRTRLLGKSTLNHLRYITSTGDHFPVPLIRQIMEDIPSAYIIPMYGLTECKRVSVMPIGRTDKVLAGSCGIPLEDVVVWLENEDEDGVGELIVCGKNVMAGYWNDANITEQYYFTDSCGRRCLRTGDLFRIDDEGFLYFIGRKKEILKVNGYRIGITELEERLLSDMNDLIDEIGIFGYPDKIIGEKIAVCVRTDHTVEEVTERLRAVSNDLSAYQRPHLLRCSVQLLPRNQNGKIDRKKLKEIGVNNGYIRIR